MPLRPASCEVRIVHVTANDQAACRKRREGLHRRTETAQHSQASCPCPARPALSGERLSRYEIEKILAVHLRAEQESDGVAAEGMTDRADA